MFVGKICINVSIKDIFLTSKAATAPDPDGTTFIILAPPPMWKTRLIKTPTIADSIVAIT